MESITDLIKRKEVEKPKLSKSERTQILKEIYEIYSNDRQKLFRKKENWKRYVQWLKDNRIPNTKENQAKFKKSKFFIKELSDKAIAIMLARNNKWRLREVLSISTDKDNRNENAGSFIMYNRFI